jgi:acrylyl-CoA reductase (NADPH)
VYNERCVQRATKAKQRGIVVTIGAPDEFRAFTARTTATGFERGLTTLTLSDLPADGVLIEVTRSSVNFKDALAASANGRVARISPLIVGIDLAGRVIESADLAFRPGDSVLAHGYELGVSRHGGFSERARIPAGWLVPLPDGLTHDDAMTIGTAGYTAALSVIALERHGLRPGSGPVLVTGATGGVGSCAVSMLAGLGHEVVASTGKLDAEPYLRSLGASAVVDRAEFAETAKPLLPTRWAGAVDCVGGATLVHVLATLAPGSAVAASGNTGGAELSTTVLPFILRGVSLLGIDSVTTPIDVRREVWRRLATDLRPAHLDEVRHEIDLDEVERALDAVANGQATGRFVVRVAD